jgi:hypothetical protein
MKEMSDTYKTAGAWIYNEITGNFDFLTYDEWKETLTDDANNSFEAFVESIKDSTLTDTVKNFSTNLFNGIKEALGL